MKYKLLEKCYIVGTSTSIDDFHPEANIEYVYVDKQSNGNKAKLKACFVDYESYTELRARRKKEYDIFEFEGKKTTLHEINLTLLNRKYREEIKDFYQNNIGKKVYIFSGEHNMYWRPGAASYTNDIKQAGIYDIKDAYECIHSNDYTKFIKMIIVDEKENN